MAELIVGLRSDVARLLHEGEDERAAEAMPILAKLGLTLQAMHPETDDPELQSWFWAEVDDEEAAGTAARLLKLPNISAAYVKPVDSAP